MADHPDFRQGFFILLRECFEGIPAGASGTWFVQGTEGLLDVFDSVSATKASRKPSQQGSSIAAHIYHVLFILKGANTYGGRPGPGGTWESSWDVQAVSEEEWKRLESDVRDEYEFFQGWVAQHSDWTNPDTTTGVLAQLPHLAYHLGAVRQLMALD